MNFVEEGMVYTNYQEKEALIWPGEANQGIVRDSLD